MLSWLNPSGKADPSDLDEQFPDEIPVLPLRGTVCYPHMILPLSIGLSRSLELINDAVDKQLYIGLFPTKDSEEELPGPDGVYDVGVIARIYRTVRQSDGSLQVVVQGVKRVKVEQWTATDPYLKARVVAADDIIAPDKSLEIEALRRRIIELAREMLRFMPQVREQAMDFLENTDNPEVLLYSVAWHLRLDSEARLKVLLEDHLETKMRNLLKYMTKELEVLELGEKIQSETQEELDKVQREYYLRQQLKAIQNELGEGDETEIQNDNYRQKFDEIGLPAEARKEAERELNRLQKLPPQAAEYGVIKTYLDWLTELPWNETTADNLDVSRARDILNADHHGLDKIKERILEFLAVRKLRHERDLTLASDPLGGSENDSEDYDPHDPNLPEAERANNAILLFVGPPGVGKTSLGRSIARALGRKFTRMSLGGVRDEAEIRGHRRTYIGAMPGRIIQALKRAGTRNPVFMLDEVDKVGSDWRGDPSSALLEVLDPQQNYAFRDHYLDLDFDLSEVMFIATANTLETIPAPLRDRMEIIRLDGYTEQEKTEIAKGYLIPRQIRTNGLQDGEITFPDEGLRQIIRDYTREAGVRTLEREIGRTARKVATKVALNEVEADESVNIDSDTVRELLGKPRYFFEAARRTEKAGVATGLSVTSVGGDVLFIEATRMRGKKQLTLTGQLGDVMKESAQIALSLVRANAETYGIDPDLFEESEIHLHVPAGAIPKDGPSAGITMVTALVSLLTGRPVRAEVGMTGEISLQGQVMPIGGLKQKVLAAHRAGLTSVILPKRNEMDLDDVPEEIRETMSFIIAEDIDEVLEHALSAEKLETPLTFPQPQLVNPN